MSAAHIPAAPGIQPMATAPESGGDDARNTSLAAGDHSGQNVQTLTEAGWGSQVREVVGVFPSTASFTAAIDALQSSGIDRARLSVLAGGIETEQQLHAAGFNRVEDLLDSPDAPRAALVEPESISIAQGALVSGLLYVGAAAGASVAIASGAIAATPIVAAVAGGGLGSAFGGILARRLGSDHAHNAQAHLAHGGLVLWARVVTAPEEARVAALMREHGGHEVHAHGDLLGSGR